MSDVALGSLPTADPRVSLFNPVVAVDGEGNAAATWSRFRQDTGMTINDWELDAAGFDAAPPTLSAVSVPPNGSRGAGVGMAAAAPTAGRPSASPGTSATARARPGTPSRTPSAPPAPSP